MSVRDDRILVLYLMVPPPQESGVMHMRVCVRVHLMMVVVLLLESP